MAATPPSQETIRDIEFVWQHDCPFNTVTREHPNLSIRWPTPAIGNDRETVIGIFSIRGGDDTVERKAISDLESFASISSVEPIAESTYKALLDREMITVPPEILAQCCEVTIHEHEGIEEWRVLTPSHAVEDFLFHHLTEVENANFDLRRKISLGFDDIAWKERFALQNRLTPKQQEAIVAGLDNGYFEYPRELTAEDIASELNITASSFLSRLRRGQRRLIEMVFQESIDDDRIAR